MSTRTEQIRAQERAWQFLASLIDREQTPRIPEAIREEAASVARHLPTSGMIENPKLLSEY